MRAYTYSIHVDRAPEAVWAFLTDLSSVSRWRAGMKSMEVVGGGPLAPGVELRVVMEAMGKISERTIRTTAFEPLRRWTTHSASGGISGDFTYAIERDGAGTKVTMSADLHAHRLLAWLFLWKIAQQERRWRAGQMETFKRLCEARL